MYSVGIPPSNRSYLSVGSHFVILKTRLLRRTLSPRPNFYSRYGRSGRFWAYNWRRTHVRWVHIDHIGRFGELQTGPNHGIIEGGVHNDGMRMWFDTP
jgi:hypothetical protein